MDTGWVKLYRKIQDWNLWTQEKFTRGQAWVDLILMANHKENSFRIRGNVIIVKRGQVGRSEDALAVRWRWSRNKVRRFLKDLKMAQQIEQQKSRILSIITIVNYDLYQENGAVSETTDDTTERQQKDTNKNVKNVKNEKKETYKENVSGVYSFYLSEINPKRKSKERGMLNIKHHLKHHSIESLKSAISNYKKTCINSEPQFRKDPANFFGKNEPYFRDFLTETYEDTEENERDEFLRRVAESR